MMLKLFVAKVTFEDGSISHPTVLAKTMDEARAYICRFFDVPPEAVELKERPMKERKSFNIPEQEGEGVVRHHTDMEWSPPA